MPSRPAWWPDEWAQQDMAPPPSPSLPPSVQQAQDEDAKVMAIVDARRECINRVMVALSHLDNDTILRVAKYAEAMSEEWG